MVFRAFIGESRGVRYLRAGRLISPPCRVRLISGRPERLTRTQVHIQIKHKKSIAIAPVTTMTSSTPMGGMLGGGVGGGGGDGGTEGGGREGGGFEGGGAEGSGGGDGGGEGGGGEGGGGGDGGGGGWAG